MLKRTLIAAAFASLALIFTTDAFAQQAVVKINQIPQRQAAKIKPIKAGANVNNTAGRAASRRRVKKPTGFIMPIEDIFSVRNGRNKAKPKIGSRNKNIKKAGGYIGETEKNLNVMAGTRKTSNRKKVKKNQDIEVENDETHRTKIRVVKP